MVPPFHWRSVACKKNAADLGRFEAGGKSVMKLGNYANS
jgi:hypothetical protein